MSPRFGLIKFNFMRAVEMFQDLNHDDMDITAPPSSVNYQKESELAQKLDDFLNELVEEGFFDDCELRDPTRSSGSSSDEEDAEEEDAGEGENDEAQEGQDDYDSQRSTPRSAGFDYPSERRSASSRSDGRSDSRSRSSSASGSNRGSTSEGSRGSFSDRFRRYIRRIIPGSGHPRSK